MPKKRKQRRGSSPPLAGPSSLDDIQDKTITTQQGGDSNSRISASSRSAPTTSSAITGPSVITSEMVLTSEADTCASISSISRDVNLTNTTRNEANQESTIKTVDTTRSAPVQSPIDSQGMDISFSLDPVPSAASAFQPSQPMTSSLAIQETGDVNAGISESAKTIPAATTTQTALGSSSDSLASISSIERDLNLCARDAAGSPGTECDVSLNLDSVPVADTSYQLLKSCTITSAAQKKYDASDSTIVDPSANTTQVDLTSDADTYASVSSITSDKKSTFKGKDSSHTVSSGSSELTLDMASERFADTSSQCSKSGPNTCAVEYTLNNESSHERDSSQTEWIFGDNNDSFVALEPALYNQILLCRKRFQEYIDEQIAASIRDAANQSRIGKIQYFMSQERKRKGPFVILRYNYLYRRKERALVNSPISRYVDNIDSSEKRSGNSSTDVESVHQMPQDSANSHENNDANRRFNGAGTRASTSTGISHERNLDSQPYENSHNSADAGSAHERPSRARGTQNCPNIRYSPTIGIPESYFQSRYSTSADRASTSTGISHERDALTRRFYDENVRRNATSVHEHNTRTELMHNYHNPYGIPEWFIEGRLCASADRPSTSTGISHERNPYAHVLPTRTGHIANYPNLYYGAHPSGHILDYPNPCYGHRFIQSRFPGSGDRPSNRIIHDHHIENYPNPYYGAHPYRVPNWIIQGTFPSPGYMQNYPNAYEIPDWFIQSRYPAVADLVSISADISHESSLSTRKPYDRVDRSSTSADISHEMNALTRRSCDADVQASTSTGICHESSAATRRSCDADVRGGASTGISRGSNVAAAATSRDTDSAGAKSGIIVIDEDDDNDDDVMIVEENSHRSIWWSGEDSRSAVEIIDLCEEEKEEEEGAKAEGENEGQEEVEVIIYEYEDNCEIWSIEPTRHVDDDFEWQEIDNEIFYVGFEHMVRTHLSERLLWFDDSIDMAPALRDRLFGRRNDANTHLQEFFEKLLNYVIGRRGLSTVEWRYFFKRCFDWLKIIKICYKFPLKYNKIIAYWFAKFLVQYAVHNVLCSDDNFIIGEAVISQMHLLLNDDLRAVGLTLLHMEMYRDLAIPLYRSIVNEFFMHHLSEWDVELYVIVVLCIVKWASFQRPSRVMADINRPEFLNLPSHVPPSPLRDSEYGPVFGLPNLSMSRTRTLLVHQLYVPEALRTFFQIYLESVGQENPWDDSLEAGRRDSDRNNEQISPDNCGAEKELERSRKRRQNLEKLPYATMPSTQSTSTHLTSESNTKRAKISTTSCNNRQMISVAYKKNSDSNLRKKSNGENSMDIIDVDSIEDEIETSQAYKPKKDSGKSPTPHKVGNLSRCSLGSANIHNDIFSASSDISVICNNINISKNNKNRTLESLYRRNRTESNNDIYLESLYEMLDTYAPSKKERNKTPGPATRVRSSNSSNNKDQNSKSSNRTLTSLYGVNLGSNVQTSICRKSSGGKQALNTLRRSISGVCSSDNKKNESGQVINESSEPLSEVRSNTLPPHARVKLNSKRSLEFLRRGRKSNLTENSISQTNNTTLRHLYGREFSSSIRQSRTQNSQKRSYREICTVVLESSSDEESAVEKQAPSPKKLPNTSAVASTMTAKSTVNSECQKKVLSIPEQCRSIIESMATKPTRKEKHCIQGEVSSTTSHDNVGHITPTPHSEFLEVHSTDAYQNARVVGTVNVVEQPNSSFQSDNETLEPGRVLLGIDYSDDDDEDDGMNDGDFLSGGYWKVIEEATSSTEITHKIQSSEVIVLSTVVTSAARPSTAESVMRPKTSFPENISTCSNLMTNANVDQSNSPTSPTKKETTSNKPVVQVVDAKISCDNCESLSDVIKCKSPSEPNCSNLGKLRTHLYNEGMGEDDSKKEIGTSALKELSNNVIVSKEGEIANENVNPSLTTQRECATEDGITEKNSGSAHNAATNRANDDAAEGGICRSGEELGKENSAMSRSCGPVDAEIDESADIEKMLADIDENLRKASEIDIKHKTEFKSVDMGIGSHSFDDGSSNEIGSFVIAESSSVGDKLNNFSSKREDDSASCKIAENVEKLNATVDNADDSICENELKQTTTKTPSSEKEPEPSSHRNHSEGVAENSINASECSDISITKTSSSPSLSPPAQEESGLKSITLADKLELEAASSNMNYSRTCLEKSKIIILSVEDLSNKCELNKLPDADISTEIQIEKNVEAESLKIVDEFVGETAMALDNATNVVGILKVQEEVSMSSAEALIEPNIEIENADNFTASNEKTQQNNDLAHHKENSVHIVERNESVENQENSSPENIEENVCVPKCSLISDVNAKNDGTSKIASDHCELDEQIMHVHDAILNTGNTNSKQDMLASASDENPVESGDTQSGSPNITQVKEIPDDHSIEHNEIGNSGLITEETVLHENVEDSETLTSDNNNVKNESPSNAIGNGVQKVANLESPKSVSNSNMSQTDTIEESVKDITLNSEKTDSQHNISQPDFSENSIDSRANGLSDIPTSTQGKKLSAKHNSKQDIDNNSDLRESGPELKSPEIEDEGILVPDHKNCEEGNESPIDGIKNTMQTLANFKSIGSSTFSNHSQTDKNEKFVEGITLNSNNTESDTNEILIEPSVRVMPETLPLQSHISNFTQEKELSTKPCNKEDMGNSNDRQSENDLHETGVTKSQCEIDPEESGEIEMMAPVHKNIGEENESRLTAIENMVQPLANLESPAIRSSSPSFSHSQTEDSKFVEDITLNSENTDSQLHSTFSNHSQTDKNEKFVEGITLNSNNTESDTNEILIEPSVRVMPETLPLQSHISNFTQEKELSTKPCNKEDVGHSNDRQAENDLHETGVTKSLCEINPEECGEIEMLAPVHKNNGEENESRLTAIENMVQPLANLESPAIRSSSPSFSHSQTEDNKFVEDITLSSGNTDSQPHISEPCSSEMLIESKAHVLSDIPNSIEEKELPAKHCSKEKLDNNSDLLSEKVIHKCTSEKSSQEIGDPEVLTSDYKKVGVENGSILKDIDNTVQTLANLERTTDKSISTLSNHSQMEKDEKYVGGISLNSDNRGSDSNEVSVDSGEIVKTDTLPLQPDIPNVTQDKGVLDEQCSAVDINSDLLSESNVLENSLEKMECKEIAVEGVLAPAEANEIKNTVNRLTDTFSIQSQTAENVELLNDSNLNSEIADNTQLISKLNTNELQTDLRSETSIPDKHCSQKDETISSDRHELCESGTEEDVSETGSEQLKDEGLLATEDEKVGHSETDNTAKLEDDTTFNTQNFNTENVELLSDSTLNTEIADNTQLISKLNTNELQTDVRSETSIPDKHCSQKDETISSDRHEVRESGTEEDVSETGSEQLKDEGLVATEDEKVGHSETDNTAKLKDDTTFNTQNFNTENVELLSDSTLNTEIADNTQLISKLNTNELQTDLRSETSIPDKHCSQKDETISSDRHEVRESDTEEDVSETGSEQLKDEGLLATEDEKVGHSETDNTAKLKDDTTFNTQNFNTENVELLSDSTLNTEIADNTQLISKLNTNELQTDVRSETSIPDKHCSQKDETISSDRHEVRESDTEEDVSETGSEQLKDEGLLATEDEKVGHSETDNTAKLKDDTTFNTQNFNTENVELLSDSTLNTEIADNTQLISKLNTNELQTDLRSETSIPDKHSSDRHEVRESGTEEDVSETGSEQLKDEGLVATEDEKVGHSETDNTAKLEDDTTFNTQNSDSQNNSSQPDSDEKVGHSETDNTAKLEDDTTFNTQNSESQNNSSQPDSDKIDSGDSGVTSLLQSDIPNATEEPKILTEYCLKDVNSNGDRLSENDKHEGDVEKELCEQSSAEIKDGTLTAEDNRIEKDNNSTLNETRISMQQSDDLGSPVRVTNSKSCNTSPNDKCVIKPDSKQNLSQSDSNEVAAHSNDTLLSQPDISTISQDTKICSTSPEETDHETVTAAYNKCEKADESLLNETDNSEQQLADVSSSVNESSSVFSKPSITDKVEKRVQDTAINSENTDSTHHISQPDSVDVSTDSKAHAILDALSPQSVIPIVGENKLSDDNGDKVEHKLSDDNCREENVTNSDKVEHKLSDDNCKEENVTNNGEVLQESSPIKTVGSGNDEVGNEDLLDKPQTTSNNAALQINDALLERKDLVLTDDSRECIVAQKDGPISTCSNSTKDKFNHIRDNECVSHKVLSVEDVEKRTPWKMRIKRRISQCSDINKEFNIESDEEVKNDAHETTILNATADEDVHELAFDIAKLDISKSKKVLGSDAINESDAVSTSWFKKSKPSFSVDDSDTPNIVRDDSSHSLQTVNMSNVDSATSRKTKCTDLCEGQNTSSDKSNKDVSEGHSLNSEEILVVTTLINMRNNYANTPQVPAKSSADTITEAKDVDGELESKTEELVPTKVVEPVVLKSILKNGNCADSIKKQVRFDEDNLLELEIDKQNEVKSASKFCNKLKTFRSAEGALLKGGNKTMKKRLVEINAEFISQLNLASGTEKKERFAGKVKRRSVRNKSQHIERNVETQVPTDKETPKCNENSEKHPLHSVGLTPRITKSADNNTKVTKEKAIDVTNAECTSCDVDETEHDPSLCVRKIDIGSAKVKIKIKTPEPKRGLKRERQITAPTAASCYIKQYQMKRAVVLVKRLKLDQTISATSNNSNSAAITPCEIAIKTEPADEEGQSPAPADEEVQFPAPASASVPCESSDVKQEIENPAYCEPLVNSCQYYYNSNNLRHSKEIILKPTDVILTEDIINEQAKAQCYEESQRAKVRRHAFLRETESSDTRNIKSGVVKQGDAAQDHSDSTITKQPDSAKPPTTVSHAVVLKATTPTSTDEPKENIAAKEPVTKSNDTDSDADDITNAITKGVIADLKMLSPENIVVQSPPNTESIKNREVPADCGKHQKCDEERTTAQLLDSSIEMVLGNSGFAKLDASCSKPQPEGAVAVNADSKLNTSDNERVKTTSPLKCRLDILTAEKINNSIEKILEHKSNFGKNIEGTSLCSNLGIHSKQDGASERDAPFMCSKVDEDISKKAAKKSLNDVKVISANVPEALFADDESENSNSDEGKDVEQFFAPILCLEPINELPSKSCADKHAVTESLHENGNRNTLGTPNFTIETEVKDTAGQCDKAIDSLSSEEKMNETPKDNAGPKSDAEELNANLEVTESSFSLPAIAEISAIDIPNDLSIANDYPDLLDAMLFEQVRQSMDCMISGTNSAKKWSQDSFTPSNGPSHSQAEVSSRIENNTDISVGVAENCPAASETKEITLNEDALGIGQDSFLGTISPLDEVEVSTTTGFDLVGSFSMEDFLADGSGDFFAFSELDKTQSRSNSFSSDSAVDTPSPSAAVADVAADEHIMEISQSVACDHSYNKYFTTGEQPENRKLPVVKSPPINSSKIPSPKKPPAESNIFSKSKCRPKPFWKVRKNDSMETSTPKKNDEKTFGEVQIGTLNTCSSSAEEKKGSASNDGVKGDLCYNMPVLETNSSLVTRTAANAKVEVTAKQLSAAKDTDSAVAVKPAAKASIGDKILEKSNVSKTGDISMPTPHISIGDRILEISNVSETGDISMPTPHSSIGDRILEISNVSETGDISMPTPHISIGDRILEISNVSETGDISMPTPQISIGDRMLEISNVSETGDISMPTPQISIGDRMLEISNVSETGDISMPTPQISIGDRMLEISNVSKTGDTPHISIPVSDISKCNWTEDIKCKRQNVNPVEECGRKGPAIEITEVITIVPPIITQPIIRIQSQTNRLERIDPEPTIAQQNYLDAASESENELIDIQRACDTSETLRDTTRDSTPTLDERMKDDEEELGPESVSIDNENLSNGLHKICPKRPLTPLADAPPPKKHCSDDEVKAQSTNDIFDMLKREESLQKKFITTKTDVAPNCNETVTSSQPQCRTPVAETANLGNKNDTNFSAQALPQTLPTIEKVKCVETLGNAKVKGSSINTPSTSSTDAAKVAAPLSTSTDQSTQIIQCKSNVVVLQSSPARSYNKTKHTAEVAAETKLNDNVKSRSSCEVSSQKNQDEASHNIGSTKRDNTKKNSPSIRLSTETAIGNTPVRCDNLVENSKPCHQPIRQSVPSTAESMRDVDISATSSRAEPLAQHSSRTSLKHPLGKDPRVFGHTLGKSSPQAKSVPGVIETPLIKIESFTPSPHYSPISPSVRHNVARMSPASTLTGKNRVHPYQKFTSTPTNYKNKYIYQRDTVPSSADSSHTHISTQRTDTAKALKSAPPVNANSAGGLNISSIKLSASDNAMISSKLESYRATLPEAKTYKEHRENQRLIKLQEEKLKLEFLEREKRRQAQNLLAEAQRLKRKSHAESHEGHYKKFSGSSVSTPASSRYANQHFQQNQRYKQRQKYVNKFSEIEKRVVTVGSEKFVAAKGARRDYVESAVSAPLTTSTAWEPKSASVDEIIAHLTKLRKS